METGDSKEVITTSTSGALVGACASDEITIAQMSPQMGLSGAYSLPVYSHVPMMNTLQTTGINRPALPNSNLLAGSFTTAAPNVTFAMPLNISTNPEMTYPSLPFSTSSTPFSNIPLHQANSNIEEPFPNNQQLYQMMLNMQAQQAEINRQNTETITQLKNTIAQLTSMLQGMINTQRAKVIPPGKFRPDRGEPLLVFLQRFEEYVKTTYPGSQEGMTFLLENYLQGALLEVYKLSLQTSIDYTEIKQQLLSWEKKQLKRKEERHAHDYQNIARREGESIQLQL